MNSAMKKSSLANRGGHVSWDVHFERWCVGDVVIAENIPSHQLLIPSKSACEQQLGRIQFAGIARLFNWLISFVKPTNYDIN